MFVKTLTGKTIPVELEKTTTIRTLSSKMFESEGTPHHRMRFIFNGKRLEDDKTFEEYDIQSDSTVFVVPVCFGREPTEEELQAKEEEKKEKQEEKKDE